MAMAKKAPSTLPDRWDGQHGTYLTGRAYIDGAEAREIEIEKYWGADRLRLMVTPDLRERFDRQRYLFRQAVISGNLEDVRRECIRMTTALNVLDAAAKATGKEPIDAEVMEYTLADGTVLAITGDTTDAWRAMARADGRKMAVYTLAEIARVLDDYQLVNAAKHVFQGATVTRIRRNIPNPLDVIVHPTGFDDELTDLWTTTEQDL